MIDLDNTLADRNASVLRWVDEFVAERSLPAGSAEQVIALDNDGYSDRRQVFEAICREFSLPEPIDRLLSDYRRRIIELAQPMPGALDCLRSLRERGDTIVIVSNGSSGQQHAKIDTLGLRPLVDAVCVSGDLDVKKPDPRIFHAAAAMVDLDLVDEVLAQTWMVGDSPLHDIAGACRVGLRTAWVRRGREWIDPHVSPTVTIDSIAELAAATG